MQEMSATSKRKLYECCSVGLTGAVATCSPGEIHPVDAGVNGAQRAHLASPLHAPLSLEASRPCSTSPLQSMLASPCPSLSRDLSLSRSTRLDYTYLSLNTVPSVSPKTASHCTTSLPSPASLNNTNSSARFSAPSLPDLSPAMNWKLGCRHQCI